MAAPTPPAPYGEFMLMRAATTAMVAALIFFSDFAVGQNVAAQSEVEPPNLSSTVDESPTRPAAGS